MISYTVSCLKVIYNTVLGLYKVKYEVNSENISRYWLIGVKEWVFVDILNGSNLFT